MNSLGWKIRKFRLIYGLKQEQLVDKLKLDDDQLILKFENDLEVPSLELLIKIAGLFSVPLKEFLSDTNVEDLANKNNLDIDELNEDNYSILEDLIKESFENFKLEKLNVDKTVPPKGEYLSPYEYCAKKDNPNLLPSVTFKEASIRDHKGISFIEYIRIYNSFKVLKEMLSSCKEESDYKPVIAFFDNKKDSELMRKVNMVNYELLKRKPVVNQNIREFNSIEELEELENEIDDDSNDENLPTYDDYVITLVENTEFDVAIVHILNKARTVLTYKRGFKKGERIHDLIYALTGEKINFKKPNGEFDSEPKYSLDDIKVLLKINRYKNLYFNGKFIGDTQITKEDLVKALDFVRYLKAEIPRAI